MILVILQASTLVLLAFSLLLLHGKVLYYIVAYQILKSIMIWELEIRVEEDFTFMV